ncbi:MAG: UvrD-helicase domain-containing protein [Defluviitaleaceae bacterium]|nr:UvrD-helicase domain-containing protein [Defluviitaleaceae bacterium]
MAKEPEYLDSLNPAQREAVMHTRGPLLIFAGAGSGKTRVLTYRAAYLIDRGVSPYNILAITFTNKAANEMRERVNSVAANGDKVWVATFHSTCVRLLRREINQLGYGSEFSIFDQADSERLIKNCIAECDLDDKQYNPRQVASVISGQKNELVSPELFAKESSGEYRMSRIAEVYTMYQEKLRAMNALDFDDLIYKTVELFDSFPHTLAKYQERFHYVMVDEYQDTNNAQYRLAAMLAGGTGNLCVVGDDDQSIYGWRGANIKNILNFEEDFPNTTVIKLEQNYRSTQTVLNAANAVIKNNSDRTAKTLWTENPPGDKLQYCKARDERDEAAFIAETIAASGKRLDDFAVLYRNNAQSRAIEDHFVMAGIPYRLYGGTRFYERMEVKDMLAYLKAIANPKDDIAYNRIINVPRRGIGGKTVSLLNGFCAVEGVPFSECVRRADSVLGLSTRAVNAVRSFADFMDGCETQAREKTVTELLQFILEETKYMEMLSDGTDEGYSRMENVKELVSKAFEFESNSEDKSLAAFLEDVALVADTDRTAGQTEAVSLMTMHSSKGLEFPCVFITGFEENLFPAYRSAASADANALQEERRLCYVGFTRAKQKLYLISAQSRMQFGETCANAVSRFYKEIPRTFIETVTRDPNKTSRTFFTNNVKKPAPFVPVPKREAYSIPDLPAPKDKPLDFLVGDNVRQAKYGVGTVTAIRPAGADYEVSVSFPGSGLKKFMAHLSKLTKAE